MVMEEEEVNNSFSYYQQTQTGKENSKRCVLNVFGTVTAVVGAGLTAQYFM